MNKLTLFFLVISSVSIQAMESDSFLINGSTVEYKGKQFMVQNALLEEKIATDGTGRKEHTGKLVLKRNIDLFGLTWKYQTVCLQGHGFNTNIALKEDVQTQYALKTKVLGLAALTGAGYSVYQYFNK